MLVWIEVHYDDSFNAAVHEIAFLDHVNDTGNFLPYEVIVDLVGESIKLFVAGVDGVFDGWF